MNLEAESGKPIADDAAMDYNKNIGPPVRIGFSKGDQA